MSRVLFTAAALLTLTMLVACGGDPEEKSGPDAYRDQATAMPLGEWVAGDLDADGGDRTDWMSFEIPSEGKILVELHADKKSAAILVGVYDRYGMLLGSATRPADSDQLVKVSVDGKRDGRHFIKIQQRSGDATAYSVRATAGSDAGGVPTPDF